MVLLFIALVLAADLLVCRFEFTLHRSFPAQQLFFMMSILLSKQSDLRVCNVTACVFYFISVAVSHGNMMQETPCLDVAGSFLLRIYKKIPHGFVPCGILVIYFFLSQPISAL
jgi:hypothetical protein